MKYYLIAGEASGDLHGSNLMKALKEKDPGAEFRFLGGDLMQQQGGTLVKHYRDMAYMGFDVVFHLGTILKNMKVCKADILAWNPDVLILIDYPGFNLRIAEFSHAHNIKTYYYIAPKVWAWKESRIKKLRTFTDKLYVIFPFEIAYFKKHGIDAEYYGNPLADSIHQFRATNSDIEIFRAKNKLSNKPIIAFVAGSRKSEIARTLPEMIEATKEMTQYQKVVAGAPSVLPELYRQIIGNEDIAVIFNQTYNLISHAEAAIVTSGTATLETALLKTPQVVVFKTSRLAYEIGRRLVKIPFFSLPNIILNKQAVKELLQFRLASGVNTELEALLTNTHYKNNMLNNYNTLEEMLGKQGVALRIAESMVHSLQKS